MDQNKKNKVKDFFRKEGFYLVLLVCLCVVATIAAFTIKKNSVAKEQNKTSNELSLNDVQDSNSSEVDSNVNKQNAERVESNDKLANNEESLQKDITNNTNDINNENKVANDNGEQVSQDNNLDQEAGVDVIYKAGGAQAVAAMAYGTKSIPKVDKICGPGNIYVALAKKAVFGYVSIDSVAGPSEILVIADETANPRYVAADLLSQAEHDEMASAILVTTSEDLAHKVSAEVDKFVAELSRKEIIQKSLDNYGYILVAKDIDEAVDVANEIASEHMEIVTKNPFDVMTKVKNAGAIFLGEYSSEPLGDYFAGPNHVLPTNGTAKFFSPLSVDDFIKKSSIISYSRNALEAIHTDIEKFATAEHLTAHANSIKVRFEN